MENKNKTAVEWLIEQLKLHETGEAEWMSESSTINHALRMQKDQHGLTFARGYMTGYAGANGHGSVDFDEYYEKEYGN